MLDVKRDLQSTRALAMWLVRDEGAVAPGMKVLEPSAGKGAIVQAILAAKAKPFAIESDEENIPHLAGMGFKTYWHRRFEEWVKEFADPRIRFDRAIMHPPAYHDLDIKHTVRAWGYVKAQGILVSVVSETAFSSGTPISKMFNQWCLDIRADALPLPKDSFSAFGLPAIDIRVVRAVKWKDPANDTPADPPARRKFSG